MKYWKSSQFYSRNIILKLCHNFYHLLFHVAPDTFKVSCWYVSRNRKMSQFKYSVCFLCPIINKILNLSGLGFIFANHFVLFIFNFITFLFNLFSSTYLRTIDKTVLDTYGVVGQNMTNTRKKKVAARKATKANICSKVDVPVDLLYDKWASRDL